MFFCRNCGAQEGTHYEHLSLHRLCPPCELLERPGWNYSWQTGEPLPSWPGLSALKRGETVEDDVQAKLDEMLQWERVHEWATAHESAPFLEQCAEPPTGPALGKTQDILWRPLACYLNEMWNSSPYDWRVGWWISRVEGGQAKYYQLPGWACDTVWTVDELEHDVVTQADFLAILEKVRP